MPVPNRKRMARAGLKKPQKSAAELAAQRLRRELKAEKSVKVLSKRLERALLDRDASLQSLGQVIKIFRGEAEPQAAEN